MFQVLDCRKYLKFEKDFYVDMSTDFYGHMSKDQDVDIQTDFYDYRQQVLLNLSVFDI